MAFCGQCGQKNPDGAKFCSACGSPLATSVDATDSRSQETPSKSERIILHRESAPPSPPRRDSTSQSRRETGNLWQDMNRNRDRQSRQEEPSRRERGYEKPAKKGGTFGGCLKKFFLFLLFIAAVVALMVWGFDKCTRDGAGGDDNEVVDATKMERIMSQASVDSLVTAKGFPKTSYDVVPRAGDYEVTAQNMVINMILEPALNGKVVGHVEMKLGGRSMVKGVYTYCGNSVYAIYDSEEEIGGKPRSYFYALPDKESLMMIDGGEYILKRKEVKPVEKSSSGLLSKDYERIFDDARFEKLRNRHEFPLSTVDVSVQPGVYTTQLEKDGVKGDITLKIEPTESDNKKILGRAEFAARVEGKGEGSQTLTVTYAGNSVYVLYPSEEEIGSLDGMVLFVSPDGKTLDCYERGDIIMSFKMK